MWRGQTGKVTAKTVDGENADGKLGFVQVKIGNDTYVLNETMVNHTDRLSLPNA